MKIPRKGMKFVIRRGKAKRKVTVVITSMYRRPPMSWSNSERMRTRHWYEIYYKTDGTWAGHGQRNMTLKGFLKLAVPK